MKYWLMKSEPDVYPWSKLVADGRGHWDGVRNHQAAINLKAMKVGDRAFFYHSNIGKEIVGVMTIARTAYPDPTDPTGRFVMVDVAPLAAVKTPVTLAQMKAEPKLAELVFLRQSRLSVSPVGAAEWKLLCRMAGIPA
ncbi:MAG: EVE domain-containing protein [Phreatobacter sp.]|uniref:EVE domain-containing protein n=1 Tax=Phreatobacter sp. TaxID=1966341 RepID=UPI001A47AD46|nr:EVE domain-containing protein [Phreatobacter sp.]MBL8567997.1 EVE domain-containing protein [Phreatobacter sp.]